MKTLRELYDELRLSTDANLRGSARSSEDPFIVKLVQLLFSYGVQIRASDIHLEPTPHGARIRYRVDGVLHELLQIAEEVRDPLTRSIKLKASLATDVVGRSKPQDGRLDFESNGKTLDLRLSSFPTIFGDVLAIRILDRSAPLLALEQLGFPQQMLTQFQQVIHRPNGFILVTGPANSGKTTTLYGALDKLRSPHIKIVTLEDPVEYQLEGIDQAPINPQVGLTFASGLRAILRQDANIILVGEIRDTETAEIAIRAALTGHLVFSTLHTRHACGAVTRLMDMGIEPHLIVTSLTGVLAQRLVRVICPSCRAPDPNARKTYERLIAHLAGTSGMGADIPPTSTANLSRGRGCPACNGTGYQGRTAIFELLILAESLKEIILDRSSSGHLYQAATASGMQSMLQDGLAKAVQGATTIEEVLRVTGETEELS